jgi:stringent starvation protein B
MAETSTKPYMIRALHEWCTDNGYTPQIVVQVNANTLVPAAYVRDGQITLNIGTMATNRLVIGNDAIEFQARFNGVTEHLYVPVGAVTAIYARETGSGMGFEVEESTAGPVSSEDLEAQALAATPVEGVSAEDLNADTPPKDPDPKRPKLTVVK